MFRKLIKKIANRFGFDVIRIQNNHCFLEKHLSNVFAKYSIDCVIDVGANTGQYAALLRRMGFNGWVVSFEPVESVFEKLAEGAMGDEKRLCYQLALGETAEKDD